MRSKNEIFLSAVNDGTFQTSSGNLAILEALLDIRDLLVKEEELASLKTAYQTLYDLHQEIIEELEETKKEVEAWKKNRNIYVEKKNKLTKKIAESNKVLNDFSKQLHEIGEFDDVDLIDTTIHALRTVLSSEEVTPQK